MGSVAARSRADQRIGPPGASPRVSSVPWIVLLSALVLVPALTSALRQPDPGLRWPTGAHVAYVSRDVVLLLGLVVTYVTWRLTRSATLGWYAALLTAASLHFLVFDLVALSGGPTSGATPDDLPDVAVLLPLPFLAFLAVRAFSLPALVNPLALGVGVASGTGGLRLLQLREAELDRVSPQVTWLLLGLAAVFGTWCCLLVLRARQLPPWARRSSTLAATLVLLTHVGRAFDPEAAAAAVLAAVSTVGAMSLTVTGAWFCLATATAVQASSTLLNDRVVQAEELVLQDREMIHELRATVAGVTKATTLLRHNDTVLPGAHRARLEAMVEQELSRMERLLEHRPARERRPVVLDDVIEPLVVAQRALGYDVRWEPSGARAVAAPDDVAEAVHILLTNAARHAPHASASVTVAEEPSQGVVVRVADTGPGIDRDVADHLFERGARSSSSPGEGIGLHVARRLLQDNGGDLHVENARGPGGSIFAMVLPAPEQEQAS